MTAAAGLPSPRPRQLPLNPEVAELLSRPRTEEDITEDNWMLYMACRDKSKDIFISEDEADEKKAKAICGVCPDQVQTICLRLAIKYDSIGVAAGMNKKQRIAHAVKIGLLEY
jgi:hypothetical protein